MVTANNIFLRSLGSALGVAVFGAIANATMGTRVTGGSRVDPVALTDAVRHIFLGVAIVAVLMVVMVSLLPRGDRPKSEAQADAELSAA